MLSSLTSHPMSRPPIVRRASSNPDISLCFSSPGPPPPPDNLKKLSPQALYLQKFIGSVCLSWCVLAWCLLSGAQPTSAMGWSLVPALATVADTLLNDLPGKLGMLDLKGQYFNAVLLPAVATAFFKNYNAYDVGIFLAAFGFINGVLFAAASETWATFWGVPVNKELTFFTKNLGFTLMALSTLLGSVAIGLDVTKAIGYSILPLLVSLADGFFFSKSMEVMGVPPDPVAAWAVIMCGTTTALLGRTGTAATAVFAVAAVAAATEIL